MCITIYKPPLSGKNTRVLGLQSAKRHHNLLRVDLYCRILHFYLFELASKFDLFCLFLVMRGWAHSFIIIYFHIF